MFEQTESQQNRAVQNYPRTGLIRYAVMIVTNRNAKQPLFMRAAPNTNAFHQALAYGERVGVACVWIDDRGGHFPPEERPVRDANTT